MTRITFNYLRDLIDPKCRPIPGGVLVIKDEKFESFEWTMEMATWPDDLFMQEIFATYSDYLRILVDEEWPAYKGQHKEEGLAMFVCRCNRHSNLFATKVEEDFVPITADPLPMGDWAKA
jgi:hypothetical protein